MAFLESLAKMLFGTTKKFVIKWGQRVQKGG